MTFPSTTTHGVTLNGTPDFVIPAGRWRVQLDAYMELVNNGLGNMRSACELFNVTASSVVVGLGIGNSDYVSGASPSIVGTRSRTLFLNLAVDTTFRMRYLKVTQTGTPNTGQAVFGNCNVTWTPDI